jgi:cystathionine beta-lyase
MFSKISVFKLGYSWGGFDSLITFPPLSKRKFKTQLKGNLIRIYCGLEDSIDQINDIVNSLKTLK